MTDPSVAYLPGQEYGPYDRGTALDVWLKAANGSFSLGLVWPGVCLCLMTLREDMIDIFRSVGVTVYPGKHINDYSYA